jgi:hypothetical protein
MGIQLSLLFIEHELMTDRYGETGFHGAHRRGNPTHQSEMQGAKFDAEKGN